MKHRVAVAAWMAVASASCSHDGQATSAATLGSTSDPSSASTSGTMDAGTETSEGESTSDASTEESTGTTGGGFPGAWCGPIPACDTPKPDPGPSQDWNEWDSGIIAGSGSPNHRGRDMFYNPGDPQWAFAKFAYGINDWDLEGEDVDIYLLRDCGDDWEYLGSARTTFEGDHPTVEGVVDTGGKVYFEVDDVDAMGPGRHRIHFVAKGDLTTTDAFIEVVPEGTPIFVSDIDGTLTESDIEEFEGLLQGTLPDPVVFSPDVMNILAELGYHPVYLSARPEFLVQRSRDFLETHGYPPGMVRTTQTVVGALGDDAVAYKTAELGLLENRDVFIDYAFGNNESDAEAYDNADIQPLDHRIFYNHQDIFGGRTILGYLELIAELEALPDLCE